MSKIAKTSSLYLPQSHKSPSLGGPLLNFGIDRIFSNTRVFWLSDGKEIMLALFVLIQYRTVTDGRSIGQTSVLWQYQRLHSLSCYRAGKTVQNFGQPCCVNILSTMLINQYSTLHVLLWHTMTTVISFFASLN